MTRMFFSSRAGQNIYTLDVSKDHKAPKNSHLSLPLLGTGVSTIHVHVHRLYAVWFMASICTTVSVYVMQLQYKSMLFHNHSISIDHLFHGVRNNFSM